MYLPFRDRHWIGAVGTSSILIAVASCAQIVGLAPGPVDATNDGSDNLDANDAPEADAHDGAALAPCSTCASDQLCCAGRCVQADGLNCFACDVKCGEEKPTCDPNLKKCACSASSCNSGDWCNGTTGSCEVCPALDANASTFFVDAHSRNSVGNTECPFKTIIEALSAATLSNASAKTIRVAAGTYAGEPFPLTIRGISLVGAGSSTTIIEGIGAQSSAEYWGNYNATLVVGDTSRHTEISGFRIVPGAARPGGDRIGVFCDEGNAGPMGTPLPVANTVLRDLEIGPSYSVNMKMVAHSSVPNAPVGPNVSVLGSKFRGPLSSEARMGIFAAGSGCGSWYSSSEFPMALSLGDGTDSGANTFVGLHGSNGDTGVINVHGLLTVGCLSQVVALGNSFSDTDTGIVAFAGTDAAHHAPNMDFVNNQFSNLHQGLYIDAPTATVTVTKNTFTGIQNLHGTSSGVGGGLYGPGVGLCFFTTGEPYPSVAKIRGNKFVGNEIGARIGALVLGASSTRVDVPITPQAVFDFGNSTEAGDNDFKCNAAVQGSAFVGGGLIIDAPAKDGGSVSLAGNRWDTTEPATIVGAGAPNGTDLVLDLAPYPTYVATPSSASTLTCGTP